MLKKSTLFASFFLFFSATTATASWIPAAAHHAFVLELGNSVFLFNNVHPAQHIALGSYVSKWQYVFTEILAGGFGPSRSTYVAGSSIGVSFYGFNLSTGALWLTRTSEALGTHWQLIQSLRYHISETPFFIGFRHFSNGARIFKHGHLPNHGENFLILGAEYTF